MSKACDPIFYKRFGIKTPIRYTHTVEVEEKIKKQFQKTWKTFYKSHQDELSESRRQRVGAFFRKLEKTGDDTHYCRRVRITYISRAVGYGVFAKEKIPPYALLIHYGALLRLDKDIGLNNDSTFSFSDFRKYSLDAQHVGNWARFMNHGDDEEGDVNVIAWECYTPEGPRIVYTAGSQGIKKGAQLLYSYGDEYWDSRDKKKKIL